MATDLNALPPSYSETGINVPESESLPGYIDDQYSAPASRPLAEHDVKEFDYKIEKNGKTFATMTLIASKSISRSVAIFLEGFPIKGKITLNLSRENLNYIESVVITIEGQLITGASNFIGTTYTFLNTSLKLPRNAWAREGDSVIQDKNVIPFSIHLPETVSMACGVEKKPEVFRLPQTFNDRYIHATTKYEISVKIIRSGIFRSNEELSAPFGFIPVVRPDPIPPLRRLAYEEGTPLLGPKVDPDGWFLQKSVQVEGKTLNNHTARVECRLFLAKPLAYTRGSIIPLFMTLESDDKSALDLLSAPKAILVRVRRRIRYHAEPSKKLESKIWRDEIDHSQRAVWWPATEYSGGDPPDRLRMLNGELHLKPGMAPTTAMGDFRIDYSVVLLKFRTPGFEHSNTENMLLSEQSIAITTTYAAGPRPRMTTPANYEPDEDWRAEDIQTSGEYSKGFY